MGDYTDFPYSLNAKNEPVVPDGVTLGSHTLYRNFRDRDAEFALARTGTSVTDMCGAICPGYDDDDVDDAEALMIRYLASRNFAVQIQLEANKACVVYGIDFDDPTFAAAWDTKDGVPFTGVWSFEVPLYLIDADYAPYTDAERPTGNIMWIDVAEELPWLRSLERAGFVRLSIPDM